MRKIICVGRQFGSGGHQIARAFAEKEGLAYFDKKIFDEAVTESGLDRKILEKAEEKKANPLFQPIYYEGDSSKYYGMNANDILFQAQKEIILQKAAEADCIIVGRCADFILKENTDYNVKSIFFTAPLDYCVQRTMEMDSLKLAEAASIVRKSDKARSAYYNFYTGHDWGKASNYDYCINTAKNREEEILGLMSYIYQNM